jgi:hypothetical protein
MSDLLAVIDPGKFVGGVAAFVDGYCVAAALVDVTGTSLPESKAFAYAVRDFLVDLKLGAVSDFDFLSEDQQIYGNGRGKADPNDLFPLSKCVGACEMQHIRTERVLPKDWKGQVPGEVFLERIHRRQSTIMTVDESAIWSRLKRLPKTKWHHPADAMALGFWRYGRLPK